MKWYIEKLSELKEIPPVYSCCGDDCAVCPRHIASTDEELAETAVFWHNVGWRDRVVSNDEIRCRGCGTRGKCTFMILPCLKEHGISNCCECVEFPCEKISDLLRRSDIKEAECKAHCTDPAEFEMLKRAFYDKRKNLKLVWRQTDRQ